MKNRGNWKEISSKSVFVWSGLLSASLILWYVLVVGFYHFFKLVFGG